MTLPIPLPYDIADIDADDGERAAEILRHGVLLVVGAPGQLQSLAGREHGRTAIYPVDLLMEKSNIFGAFSKTKL